jgi:ubiquinone biosynthesis protein UbiJ
MPKAAALASLEAAINGALVYDPGSRSALRELDGKPIAIRATSPAWELGICAQGEKIKLLGTLENPEAEVLGPTSALLELGRNPGVNLANTELEVRGNTQLLAQWQALANGLDIDWRDALGKFIGQVPAHALGEAVASAQDWRRARSRNIKAQLAEYLVEEAQLLPNRALFDEFAQNNQALQLEIDRLAARVSLLAQRNTAGKDC